MLINDKPESSSERVGPGGLRILSYYRVIYR